jgi:hypothetical protein
MITVFAVINALLQATGFCIPSMRRSSGDAGKVGNDEIPRDDNYDSGADKGGDMS